MDHTHTETASPNTATTAYIGSGKINSNRTQSTEGQDKTTRLPAYPGVDVTLAASSGESDGNS